MNIKQQILIDKLIAKPVAYFFNFIVRILGQLLKINHSLDREFKTIVICKFKGMGSIIQATPMINAIRVQHPNAEIIFVSTKTNETVLKKITWINTIVTVDDSSLLKFILSNIKSLLFLIRKRPEVYFDLEIYSDYSTLFTLFSLSTNRIGFYLRSSSFRMGIYTHMMFFNPRVPISEVYLQLARLIVSNTKDNSLYPLVNEGISRTHNYSNYIVINPNASDLRIERRWDKHNFVALIELILKEFTDKTIVIIGSSSEKKYSEEIKTMINNPRVINTAGKTSIDELIGIIKNAKLMVTNDTGPMHIAFCTNTPIICLFGPCSPEQYGMNNNAHIIYKKVYCSPCVHDFEIAPCKGNNTCMQLISTSEVFEKVKELIVSPISHNSLPQESQYIFDNGNVLGKVIR
ncbi:MAG: glycosyltransferase family 9 protein [Flavobacteriales bacterium]|nr:glycosyltransferase family 9 protein [Flavobacteriales bacterium]